MARKTVRKAPARRTPAAAALALPQHRARVRPSKKAYKRRAKHEDC